MKRFLSGDEALAEGVRLARPQVISAYPITPQTVKRGLLKLNTCMWSRSIRRYRALSGRRPPVLARLRLLRAKGLCIWPSA